MSVDAEPSPDSPASTPAPSETPSIESPPSVDRALWWEVLAVLAIGVFTPLGSAIVGLSSQRSGASSSYRVDSFDLTFQSACTTFVVLYLIWRSGEPWSSFGITHLRFT